MSLQQNLSGQQFANDYELVNGVEMHAENGERFQIPHAVLKKHVAERRKLSKRKNSSQTLR